MHKLTFKQLPEELRSHYTEKQIHKAVQKGATKIIVHLKPARVSDPNERHFWEKSKNVWSCVNTSTDVKVQLADGERKLTLWGFPLHIKPNAQVTKN